MIEHNFVQLGQTQKEQKTLYCGGLDIHLFGGYDANMAIYGSVMDENNSDHSSTVQYYLSLTRGLRGFPEADAVKFARFMGAAEIYTKKVINILVTKCNIRVFKPQSAFYEAFGPLGNILLSRISYYIKDLQKDLGIRLICQLDCKRGDIDTTQAAYFTSLIGNLYNQLGINYAPYDFDIINVNPWMGPHDILVLGSKENPGLGLQLMQKGKGLIVVSKTSNPWGPLYQEEVLQAHGVTLQMKNTADLYKISKEFELECDGLSTIGMVVGSTHICDGTIRKEFPSTTLLVPGFGAQGGSFHKIMQELIPDGPWAGQGAMFSSSRGTMYPFETKFGGSGHVANLEEDLIKAIDGFREAEKKAYEEAGIYYPFA